MQRLSSKNNELLMHVSELFDGQCHQKLEGDEALLVSDEAKQHFKHWALIGSALRRELHGKVDPNFSEKVMAKITANKAADAPISLSQATESVAMKEELPSALRMWKNVQKTNSAESLVCANDGASESTQAHDTIKSKDEHKENHVVLQLPPRVKFFKRVGIVATQIGIAAGVAVVAVIGMQTYNAADTTNSQPVVNSSAFSAGPVSGLNLASYQTSSSDYAVKMDKSEPLMKPEFNGPLPAGQETAQYSQKQDIERVNSYLQGYVNDSNN